MSAPDHDKPRLLREVLLNHDLSPSLLSGFAEGVQEALLALPSVQAMIEEVWQYEQEEIAELAAAREDEDNPSDHERSESGCPEDCRACA